METDLSGSSVCNIDQEELLKSAKAKMGEVKEENERLKKLIVKILKDYETLEKQVSSIRQPKQLLEASSTSDHLHKATKIDDGQLDPEWVSLTLGRWSSDDKKEEADTSSKRRKVNEGLELGLDCKFEHRPSASATDSMKNSTHDSGNEEAKEEVNTEAWSPSRGIKPKENTTTSSREGDDENLHPPQVKKTRVCIRSRCDAPTMNDGCQWRKYGQKIAKGNPCPRAYYRCTVSPTCPVRKQVQRYPDDMSILITTYEGTHNHPLPHSATAMASATSAAAAMIKTGPLSSQQSLMGSPNHTTTTMSSSFGLHNSHLINPFNMSNPRLSIPNPSMISSSSHAHPTVTLDLTTANPNLSPFNWLSSSSSNSSRNDASNFLNFSSSHPISSTSLDFSSSATPARSVSWPSSGFLNYGTMLPFNNNNSSNNNYNGSIYQNPSSSPTLNDTIAAMASKAIASNPNFQSVLAAAISSYVGNKASENNEVKKSPSPPSNSATEGRGSFTLFPTSTMSLDMPKDNDPSRATETNNHSTS